MNAIPLSVNLLNISLVSAVVCCLQLVVGTQGAASHPEGSKCVQLKERKKKKKKAKYRKSLQCVQYQYYLHMKGKTDISHHQPENYKSRE